MQSYFMWVIADFTISSEIDKTVNGNPAKQVEIHSVINKSIKAGYHITFIETNDRFYRVLFWTSTKQMDVSKDDLTKIVSTFKEIKK
ncbi:ribulose bisphosphate carboxylase small subunit [Paenibacillus sp. V4I9]|nr:ribulose bisphosphate carboxylase small subunit [Paenibacillus sp. V4I9]